MKFEAFVSSHWRRRTSHILQSTNHNTTITTRRNWSSTSTSSSSSVFMRNKQAIASSATTSTLPTQRRCFFTLPDTNSHGSDGSSGENHSKQRMRGPAARRGRVRQLYASLLDRQWLPKRLILVRHGESVANVDKEVYSHTPDWAIPLTPRGKQQAFNCGKRLKRIVQDEKIYIYYSPYIRTKQTLKELRRGLSAGDRDYYGNPTSAGGDGQQSSPAATEGAPGHAHTGAGLGEVPVWLQVPQANSQIVGEREDERLREQEMGNYQPLADMDVTWRRRNQYSRLYYRFPYGESSADVGDRVSAFFDSLLRERLVLDMMMESEGEEGAGASGKSESANSSSTSASNNNNDADAADLNNTKSGATATPSAAGSRDNDSDAGHCNDDESSRLARYWKGEGPPIRGGKRSSYLNNYRSPLTTSPTTATGNASASESNKSDAPITNGHNDNANDNASADEDDDMSSRKASVGDEKEHNVVIVAHGLLIRLFVGRWFRVPMEVFETMSNPPNCALVVLTRETNLKENRHSGTSAKSSHTSNSNEADGRDERLVLTEASKRLFGSDPLLNMIHFDGREDSITYYQQQFLDIDNNALYREHHTGGSSGGGGGGSADSSSASSGDDKVLSEKNRRVAAVVAEAAAAASASKRAPLVNPTPQDLTNYADDDPHSPQQREVGEKPEVVRQRYSHPSEPAFSSSSSSSSSTTASNSGNSDTKASDDSSVFASLPPRQSGGADGEETPYYNGCVFEGFDPSISDEDKEKLVKLLKRGFWN